MKPEQLVKNIRVEIDNLITLYEKGSTGATELGYKLDSIGLSPEKKDK